MDCVQGTSLILPAVRKTTKDFIRKGTHGWLNSLKPNISHLNTTTGKLGAAWCSRRLTLRCKKASSWRCWGTTARENPPWPSTSTRSCSPPKGRCIVAGIDTKDEDRLFDIRQQVGMVFQNPDNQIVATVVEEDVAFAPGKHGGANPAEIRRRVDDALRAVGMYGLPQTTAPHQLSGGQKQRVAIAGSHRHAARAASCWMSPPPCWTPRAGGEVLKTIHALNRELRHHRGADHPLYGRGGARRPGGSGGRRPDPHSRARPGRSSPRWSCSKQAGLDVPQVTELAFELRKAGIELPADILTEEECAAALDDAFGGEDRLPAVIKTEDLSHVYSARARPLKRPRWAM